MLSLLQLSGTSAAGDPGRRDPQQLRDGALYLLNQRHPPPGGWTDNRLAQAQHYKGVIFLALNAVQKALAGAAAWCERRKRRDRTTIGPKGERAVVKALDARGGQGNDEEYEPFEHDAISRVLRRPNPAETFGAVLAYQTIQWGLTGNAPAWFVPGLGHGRPVEVYPLVEALLQPAFTGPHPDYPEGAWYVNPYGGGWSYGTLGQRTAARTLLPGQEVRKLRAPHPLIRTDGYSPLTACGVQFDIMEAIDRSRHAAFMQGAQLGTIIYLPGAAEEVVAATAANFNQNQAGPDRARRTAVVGSPPGAAGQFKIEQLGESPREMDYGTSWMQAAQFVLGTYGVHAATAGIKDTSGYAELYAAQMQDHLHHSGLARQFATFYTLHLADPWSRRPGELRVHVELPEPRNKESDAAAAQALIQMGAVPLNTGLRALNYAPVRYGDLPLPLYLKKVESIEFPQPVMPPGGLPQPDAAPDESVAPAGGPTAGAPPKPDNPAGKGSLPPRVAKGAQVPAGGGPISERGAALLERVLAGDEQE